MPLPPDFSFPRVRQGLFLIVSCLLLLCSARSATAALGDLITKFNLPVSRFAVDPVRPRIYASLTASNAVAVIDTSTLKVVKVIPIGSKPLGLAVSADGNTLYVANSGSTAAGVGVIDLATLGVLPSLPTPEPPSDIAAGLNGELYLTLATSDPIVGSIMQVSTSGTVPAQFFGAASNASEAFLAISPDRTTLYYGDSGLSPATLASYNVTTVTGTALQTAPTGSVGSNGEDLEISHEGQFLSFVTGSGQGSFGIAEIPANNLSGSNGLFATQPFPSNITFSPDDGFAYTVPRTQNTVRIFSTSTYVQTGSFPIPGDAVRLVTDSSGKYLFVAGLKSKSAKTPLLYVYDTGRLATVITSGTSVFAAEGAAFSYQITASNSPVSFDATDLPPGLTVTATSGLISGTPTALGPSQVILTASSPVGVARATLTINVEEGLNVDVNGDGSVTSGFLGTSYHLPGDVTITARPAAGSYFAGWTGDITSGSDPLTFDIESDTSIQANFQSWSPYDGLYFGLFDGNAGFLSIRINDMGQFSALVRLGPFAYPVYGNIRPDNTITIPVPGNPPITLVLTLDITGPAPVVSSTATGIFGTATVSALQAAAFSGTNPDQQAGYYTLALVSSTETEAIPGGAGIATMRVAASGQTSIAGLLADGTPFSFSLPLAGDGTLPIFDLIYGSQGYLSGVLNFQSQSNVGKLNGAASWSKPSTAVTTFFPDPFLTSLTLVGSSYSSRVGFSGSNGTIAFSNGNISAPFSQSFTINSNNTVAMGFPNPHFVTLSIDSKTGVFGGAFLDRSATRHFRGVILQQQNSGDGLFVDPIGSGQVTLTVTH